jgi:hypothetical protein
VEDHDVYPISITHNGAVTFWINLFIPASHNCTGRLFQKDRVTVFGKSAAV